MYVYIYSCISTGAFSQKSTYLFSSVIVDFSSCLFVFSHRTIVRVLWQNIDEFKIEIINTNLMLILGKVEGRYLKVFFVEKSDECRQNCKSDSICLIMLSKLKVAMLYNDSKKYLLKNFYFEKVHEFFFYPNLQHPISQIRRPQFVA